MGNILEGVQVLDLAQVLAGPTVSRLMVELGATVRKVEPLRGETGRYLPHVRDGWSGYFVQQNRGKHSVALDITHPDGAEVLDDLIEHSDVIVESFSPRNRERLGFSPDQFRARWPSKVLCSISALGLDGPLANEVGYDTVGAAYSGVLGVSGQPGGPPGGFGVAIGDVMTGVHGFGGVMAALFHRERTGEGNAVAVSLLDTYMHAHEINIQAVSGSGGDYEPSPSGQHHATVVPAGIFDVGRGDYLFMACVSDADWRKLAEAMGREELGVDERYATNQARLDRREEVLGLIDRWFADFDDAETAVAHVKGYGVVAAPVLTVKEAMEFEHNRARRVVRTVPERFWGEIDLPGVPIRLSHGGEELELQAPLLGEQTRAELTNTLGYGDARLDELEAKGVIVCADGTAP